METIDTNVDNYTLIELMTIINIDDLDPDTIIKNTSIYINKFKKSNPKISEFFKNVQKRLLLFSDDNVDEDENNDNVQYNEAYEEDNMEEEKGNSKTNINAIDDQIKEWYKNTNLAQDDPVQVNKITDRKDKVRLFSDRRFPMKREQLGTTDTYNLPVKQDTLNPNLKNTVNRFINLDSQFRQFTTGTESQSTNYTCNLSDTLKNTVKLSLYSYQIPFSWYTIDSAYGNTCLWINDISSGIIVPVSISSGNYTQTQFQVALNNAFLASGFSFPPAPTGITVPVNYNINSGLLTLYLYDASYNGTLGSFTVSTTTQILFYDFKGIYHCNTTCSSKNHYFNNTLGWIMGYRIPYVQVDPSGNQGTCILNLNGTKYLILVVDDYNQNHVNNSLVSISKFSNVLKMPNYYSPDIPYTCITPEQRGNNLDSIISTQNGLLIAGKYEEDYTSTQIVLPSAPRTLTNAQLYTINSINNNNNNLTNYLTTSPTSADILAIIPVKTSVESTTGTLLVEFSGSLQDNVRTYFGPVDIDRMAVKLLDDKGNVLNLNGTDWCVTLIAECLYQY
jgi:hypothetical protein